MCHRLASPFGSGPFMLKFVSNLSQNQISCRHLNAIHRLASPFGSGQSMQLSLEPTQPSLQLQLRLLGTSMKYHRSNHFCKMLNVHCIWWTYLMFNLIQVFLIKTSFTINRTLIHIFCFIYYFRYGGTIYGFLFTSDIINNLLVKSILYQDFFCF